MSAAALYVLLIPAIGYICLYKQNKLNSKTKPISGLELTYHSAIYGGVFLAISYIVLRTASYYFHIDYTEEAKPFFPYFFEELVATKLIYFVFAAVIAWIYTIGFMKFDTTSWDGDSNLGRIWYELLVKEAIVVLFLKNGKCYQGQLMEVEVSERVSIEDRPVTLFVILSGFRNSDGLVDWNTSYQLPLRHHFMMSEIVNFSEHSPGATFKIGSKKKAQSRRS